LRTEEIFVLLIIIKVLWLLLLPAESANGKFAIISRFYSLTRIAAVSGGDNTWGDNYFILLTTVIAAMLEVYLLQQCNVVNLRVLTNCCVWNYTPVEKHGLPITLA